MIPALTAAPLARSHPRRTVAYAPSSRTLAQVRLHDSVDVGLAPSAPTSTKSPEQRSRW